MFSKIIQRRIAVKWSRKKIVVKTVILILFVTQNEEWSVVGDL